MENLVFAVEDDDNIRELIKCTLTAFSYQVRVFACAEDMLQQVQQGVYPSVFLLDIMLPGMNGLEALRMLKENPRTKKIPVIMLTAKSLETDKVTGLDSGADDYLTKPFGVLELTARIRAVCRRTQEEEKEEKAISYKELMVDPQRHLASLSGKELPLTLKEFELLYELLSNEGRAVSREELLNKIWGFDFQGESRTLDMHIKTLRQKLGDNADDPKYIKTVRGIGYIIV